jgi:O-antigen ligase
MLERFPASRQILPTERVGTHRNLAFMTSIASSIRSVYQFSTSRSLTILEWVTGAIIAAALIAPRGAFVYLSIWAVAVLVQQRIATRTTQPLVGSDTYSRTERDLPDTLGATVAWIGLCVFVVYAAATSFLVDPNVSSWFRKPFQAAAVIFSCWLICRAFSRYGDSARWHIARGALHGFVIGLVYIGIEHVTAGGLKAAATNATGLFPVGANANVVRDGQVVAIGKVFLNRHTVAMVVLAWAAALSAAVWLAPSSAVRRTLGACLLGTVVVLAALSSSETAKLAVAAGLLIGLLARFVPRIAQRLVVGGWTVLVLGIIPLILVLLPPDSPLMKVLPYSAKDRVVIWNYTIKRLEPVPILGHGAASTPLLAAKNKKPTGRKLVPRLSRHAHNVYLQTWFELGGLGALLLLVIGLGILSSIGQASAAMQPFLLAQYVAIASVALTGYGMWQVWLLSLVAISTCIMSCVAHPSATFFVSRRQAGSSA